MKTAMDDQQGRTEYVDVAGGRIAYEVIGQGRWWCCLTVWVTIAAPTASLLR